MWCGVETGAALDPRALPFDEGTNVMKPFVKNKFEYLPSLLSLFYYNDYDTLHKI